MCSQDIPGEDNCKCIAARIVACISITFLGIILIFSPSFFLDVSFLNISDYSICSLDKFSSSLFVVKCFLVGLAEWIILLGILFLPIGVYFLYREARVYYLYGFFPCLAKKGEGLSEMIPVTLYIPANHSASHSEVY